MQELWHWKDFPQTGIFVEDPFNHEISELDQVVLFCSKCTHVQLKYVIDPTYLYGNVYNHRGGISPIASKANHYFLEFAKNFLNKRNFKTAIDVGCNDLYLLKLLKPFANSLIGIDPIWKQTELRNRLPQEPKLKVLGAFVEEITPTLLNHERPDLVVSTHTFEHLSNCRDKLKLLIDLATDDALFLVEVPAFDSIVNSFRFDQIFHQHIQYFSLASFGQMLKDLDCSIMGHKYNLSFWGGSLLIAFSKQNHWNNSTAVDPLTLDREKIYRHFKIFKDYLAQAKEVLENWKGRSIIGFGAAQTLPTLAFHMNSDFDFLDCIFDDSTDRVNRFYPNIRPKIKPVVDYRFEDSLALVTALDSSRGIISRLSQLHAAKVVLPLPIF